MKKGVKNYGGEKKKDKGEKRKEKMIEGLGLQVQRGWTGKRQHAHDVRILSRKARMRIRNSLF